MGAPWTHPTRLWHPSSPCLVGRGYRLSENWWEKNTRTICLLYKSASLYFSSTKKQTCRKGNGPVWCWDATLHEHRGSRALGESPAAPARPDHEAAAPPGHTSTSMAGSPGSASTNITTTAGSPGLGKSKQALNTKVETLKAARQDRRSNVSFTNGGVGSHIVAVVKTDEGQVGHVWGEGQDQENSHYARHGGSPQAQSSE